MKSLLDNLELKQSFKLLCKTWCKIFGREESPADSRLYSMQAINYEILREISSFTGFLDDHANELVQLVFQTLGVYSDPKLQKGVLSYLRNACSQSETFNKTLAGSIVRNGPQKLSRQQALTLLQWSTIVIRNLDVQKAQKAVQKLIECQVYSSLKIKIPGVFQENPVQARAKLSYPGPEKKISSQ